MQTLSEIVAGYKILLENGESLKVIEQYYTDDFIQIENNNNLIVGKEKIVTIEKNNI